MTRIESGKVDFRASLAEKADLVNSVLIELLERQTDIQPQLATAMNYTLKAPGKRIRAAIVLWCCELIAGRINDVAKTAAAAIEMVHTYSLIHDDLPAINSLISMTGTLAGAKKTGLSFAIRKSFPAA